MVLHWTTAALVVLLSLSAQVIDVFPDGPARVALRSVHMTMGAILACVFVYRILWRSIGGFRLPGIGSPSLVLFSRAVHLLLHGNRALRRRVNGLHDLTANTIPAVAGVHAAAGL